MKPINQLSEHLFKGYNLKHTTNTSSPLTDNIAKRIASDRIYTTQLLNLITAAIQDRKQ